MRAMKNLIHQITVHSFITHLTQLQGQLSKAENYAKERNFSPDKYLSLTLAVDMFPFVKQVQIVTDNAKLAAARLSQTTAPVFEDTEATFGALQERIAKTLAFLKEIPAERLENYAQQKATFSWNPGQYLEGNDYLVQFALPNFYFHLSMAYALLRQAGVPLGKMDFLGPLSWHS